MLLTWRREIWKTCTTQQVQPPLCDPASHPYEGGNVSPADDINCPKPGPVHSQDEGQTKANTVIPQPPSQALQYFFEHADPPPRSHCSDVVLKHSSLSPHWPLSHPVGLTCWDYEQSWKSACLEIQLPGPGSRAALKPVEPGASHLHRVSKVYTVGAAAMPSGATQARRCWGLAGHLDATRVTKTTASLLASKRTRRAQRATIRGAFGGGGKQSAQVAC